MSNRTNKPKLTSQQLIEKMRDEKGITFNHDPIDEAEHFLKYKNNYLRLACYRNSYQKYPYGKNAGKYINLDFAYLKELSILDMHYRFIVKKMCSDIEHFLSIRLLLLIENDSTSDGYDIVKDFLSSNPYVLKKISDIYSSPHVGDLIQKYFTIVNKKNLQTSKIEHHISSYDDCPAWVLVECLTFGDLISFYQFYCDKKNLPPVASKEIFNLVRSLRNGVSHENCMFCKLPSGTCTPSKKVSIAVKKLCNVSQSQRQKKLSSRTVLEFTSLLYLYSLLINEDVKNNRISELKQLFYDRMLKKKDFFKSNTLITSTYNFCCKMIEGFFPS